MVSWYRRTNGRVRMQIGPTMQVKKHRTPKAFVSLSCAFFRRQMNVTKDEFRATNATENPRAKAKKVTTKVVQNTKSTYRAFTKWSLKVKSCKNTLCFLF